MLLNNLASQHFVTRANPKNNGTENDLELLITAFELILCPGSNKHLIDPPFTAALVFELQMVTYKRLGQSSLTIDPFSM